MSTIPYDSSLVPTGKRPKRHGWLRELFFGPAVPERPAVLKTERTPRIDWRYEQQPLADFEPKKHAEPIEEPSINRLDDIALLVRRLTYAEMMELSQAVWETRPNEIEPLDDRMLPGVLHKWSTSR